MKQKIGALRLLAKVNPKLAEPLLAKARQSEIAELKQAVAAFSQPPAAPPPTTPNLEAVQVDAVLAALAAGVGPDQQATAVRLANSAYPPVALAARQALAVLRPEAPLDAARFDLEIAHPYTRRQLLDRHRDQPDFLLAACRNPDPPTRALALARLAKADPAAAKSAVAEALNDPYLWVRLHAASLSQQAVVRPATAILQAALDAETDPAVRQLLRQALGIAGDLPAAARSVAERPNLRWLCGYGADAVTSPFDAYYLFEPRLTPLWQDAHAAGKIFFSRLSPIGNPGSVVTDTRARDAFWLNLLAQLPSETLPYLDGVVYGEETMRLAAEDLWDSGWQLFCLDAGLDPGRVAGNPEALTSIERDAWLYWARERGVEGFNELYRFTKLYFGALRPGIQVATFLPKELLLKDGTYPPDRQMQFDVGGIYDYKGCNRLAGYWLVRRYKTLWPDRPVLWLSLGIGGYEMNPVMHTHQPPTAPLATRQARAYADTISAWLAGAQAGWFSVWIFVLPTHQSGMPMSGVVVNLEDAGNVPLLQRGADLAYRGVVDLRLTKEAAKNAPTLGEAAGDGDAAFTLDDKPDPRQMEAAKIAVEQQALIAGMQLYQKYVYDCVRVFGDLPERPTPLPVLLVRDGISVWSRDGELPLIPGFGLFQSGDFVCEINHLASMELSRYRVIAIHDPAQLRDETIAALTAWLRDTEGTLYIHGDLTADNTREMPTPRDLDGRLERDWPWEGSLTIRPQAPAEATTADLGKVSIVATIDGGESLLAIDGQTVLARWRSPDFKGTVIVDGLSRTGPAYLDLLAPHLAPGGPPWFLQMGETGGLTLVAGSRYYSDARRPYPLPDGIDLLTGDQAPTIGVNSDGAILATDFQGRRAIVHNGIAILAEQPFTQVERLPDGLRLHGGGLVRVQIHNGTLRPLDLPEAEAPLTFLLSTEPGQTTLEGRLYFRSPKPVNLIRQP